MAVFERISKRVLRAAALSVLVAAAVLVAAGSAQAGEYQVYSCRTPSGEVAPTDGWSGSVVPAKAYFNYANDTCEAGGALIAALGDQTTHQASIDRATWTFEAPAGDRLVGATLWRAGYLHGEAGEHASYRLWLAGPAIQNAFDDCLYTEACPNQGETTQPMSSANLLPVPPANLGAHLYVSVSCGIAAEGSECGDHFGDPNGYAAVVYLYAADLTLEQEAGPSADGVSGELASAPTVSGTSDVAFSATDPGSGVYEAVFSVDGQVVQSAVLDENGGRCKNVDQSSGGQAAFLYLQPCPGSVSADVGFDTTKVSNGAHHLVVSVIDAAGNAAPVLDREVTVANPPAPSAPGPSAPALPNGTNASTQATLAVSWKGTKSERLTAGYGRAETITGQLTAPGGVPISGAQVEVLATPDYTGAKQLAMASARTGQDGRFTVRLPGGVSSRTLRFAYRSHLGDALPVATRRLTLTVRAGMTLTISPRTASVGRSIFFRGRLRGGPIPADGKQLVLEARSPGGPWIEFDVIRTDSRGRYHGSYRFKFPGPANYQFRVLSEPESDYPFAAGSSDVVGVQER
jgi:hypothetical protein